MLYRHKGLIYINDNIERYKKTNIKTQIDKLTHRQIEIDRQTKRKGQIDKQTYI